MWIKLGTRLSLFLLPGLPDSFLISLPSAFALSGVLRQAVEMADWAPFFFFFGNAGPGSLPFTLLLHRSLHF